MPLKQLQWSRRHLVLPHWQPVFLGWNGRRMGPRVRVRLVRGVDCLWGAKGRGVSNRGCEVGVSVVGSWESKQGDRSKLNLNGEVSMKMDGQSNGEDSRPSPPGAFAANGWLRVGVHGIPKDS